MRRRHDRSGGRTGERFGDATLLVLKMKEMSQGKQVDSRSWKKQENEPPEGKEPTCTLILT